MFGLKELIWRAHRKIDAVRDLLEAAHDDVGGVDLVVRDTHRKVSSMETWIELLADTKADAVAEEFERLLDESMAAKKKLNNKMLVEMVHQAVLNTTK